ncbi:MAG TPA: DNA repair protein RadA [Patescibacteria group bacterium]|nr:DNA repair protein RadA [Patescibacteria group bacterium]
MAFHSKYICQQCGYESTGWMGKCPNCNSWNSLVETVTQSNSKSEKRKSKQGSNALNSKPINLSDIKTSATIRTSTKISELDRVLGGGLVSGQAILIAGEPGIGKSTLLTQLSSNLGNVLYVCGEESANQVKVRSERLGIKKSKVQLLEETDADSIIETIDTIKDTVLQGVIVDSIQTMSTSDLSGMAGSVGQVRECAFRLIQACKSKNIPLFLVGHVTKEGTVAGPAVLAHIVDTVLWFEGDKTLTIRILRAVKNRFGPTDEVGVFQMEDRGLIPVDDAEKLFLEKSGKNVAGSVVTSVMQGSRPLLVEIQALVVPTKLAIPRRIAQGIDSRRLEMLLAVLTRRCGLPMYDQDVFINVAGGLKVTEPATDLAICLSVASAYFDKPVSAKTIAVGEVGLLGEIREVVAQDKRIKEARRMGFTVSLSSKITPYVSQVIKQLFK